jgi:hypothetical protein
MHAEPTPSNLDRVVASLVQWAGMGSVIIDHMARFPAPANGSSAQDAFVSVLRSALAPLTDRHAAADLDVAATTLADAIETAAEEILLVDCE